jgi:DNA-binding HxlR family transcriptional regulator
VLPDTPARVEYELTDAGKELAVPLKELKAWSHRWLT